MFVTDSLKHAREQLDKSIRRRLRADWTREHGLTFEAMDFPFDRVRFPVGMFFIRGDRGGKGKELAEEVVASFGFWNDDSGKYFDMVFPGWGTEDREHIVFDREHFLSFNNELNKIIKWKEVSRGETDILLMNFDYVLAAGSGDFSFAESIHLPVEAMLRDGRISSLDALMYEIIRQGEKSWPSPDEGVWEISDRLAFHKGSKALWDVLKEKFLIKDLAQIHHELRPYAVCDLRR